MRARPAIDRQSTIRRARVTITHATADAREAMRFPAQLEQEDGFALLEVIVSAALLAVMVVAVFTTFDVTNRVSAQDKSRAVAASLAQDEQERLRAMPPRLLSSMMADRGTLAAPKSPYKVDNVSYKIASRVEWLRDSTQVSACTSNGAAADYMRIVSTASAPATMGIKPVTVTSVVTPPGGAFGAGEGSLAVTILGADGTPKPNVAVALSGAAGGGSRTTDSAGCAFFGYQPVGSYTTTASAVGYVDVDGNPTASTATPIAPEAMSSASLRYDVARTVTARFVTQKLAGDGTLPTTTAASNITTSSARWLTFANGGMSAPKKVGSATTAASSLPSTPLFPFSDGYAVYAGDCTGARPATTLAASGARPEAPAQAAPGVAGVDVLVPAISLTVVTTGTDPTRNQLANAKIRLTPKTTGCAGTFDLGGPGAKTQSDGRVLDPGVPFGTYSWCVQGDVGDGVTRAKSSTTDVVNTGAAGVLVGAVALSGAAQGTCP
jgi:Tfp pilus assembly protein PilV